MTGWCQVLGDKTKVYSHKSNWPNISDQKGEKNKMSWRQTVLLIIFHSLIYTYVLSNFIPGFWLLFRNFNPWTEVHCWSFSALDWEILLDCHGCNGFGKKIHGWMSNCHYLFYFSIVFPIWINDSYLWEISRIQDNHQHQNHKLSSLEH